MEKNVNGCQQDWSNEDAEVLNKVVYIPMKVCRQLYKYAAVF